MLLPLNPNLTVFYWWIGQSLQVRPTPLPDSPSHRLPSGMSGGGQGTWLQGTVWDHWKGLILAFLHSIPALSIGLGYL